VFLLHNAPVVERAGLARLLDPGYCYLWVNPYIPTIRPDEEILELETD